MSDPALEPIDQLWIKQQIDELLAVAKQMSDSPMKNAIMLRCDNYLDLVKAWRERTR